MKNRVFDILTIERLCKSFPRVIYSDTFRQRSIKNHHAVRNVDLSIRRGEFLGLIGESGSGKTTLGRLIVRLEEPDEGRIYFNHQNISYYSTRLFRKAFSRKIQLVFQNPEAALNPGQKAGEGIRDLIELHYPDLTSGETRKQTIKLIESVRLHPAEKYYHKYPHQLSGGEKRRLSLTRALAVDPDLLIIDEPAAELDPADQNLVINILRELRRERDKQKFPVSSLIISHDLGIIKKICDSIAVMHKGEIIEKNSKSRLLQNPIDPYTIKLLEASLLKNSFNTDDYSFKLNFD